MQVERAMLANGPLDVFNRLRCLLGSCSNDAFGADALLVHGDGAARLRRRDAGLHFEIALHVCAWHGSRDTQSVFAKRRRRGHEKQGQEFSACLRVGPPDSYLVAFPSFDLLFLRTPSQVAWLSKS